MRLLRVKKVGDVEAMDFDTLTASQVSDLTKWVNEERRRHLRAALAFESTAKRAAARAETERGKEQRARAQLTRLVNHKPQKVQR